MHFRGSVPTLGFAAILLGISGLLPAGAVWALRGALDALIGGGPADRWLLALLGIAAAQSALMVGRSMLTRRLAMSLVHDLRMRVHQRFHEVCEPGGVGERLAALTHESDELQYGVSALVTALRNPISATVLLLSAISLAPSLAWRVALLVPLLGGIAWLGGVAVRSATRRWTGAHRALLSELSDQHGGLHSTIDLGATAIQRTRAERVSRAEATARARRDWVRAVPPALVQFSVALALVALLSWGIAEVRDHTLSPGQLVAFIAAIALLQRPLTGLTEVWTLLQRSITALERIEALLAAPTRASPQGTQLQLHQARVGGRLGPISLTVHPGEKLAIVGASGSGKSTLLAVLSGHLPAQGSVQLAPTRWLRQEPWVFDRSVAENLRLGAPQATDADLSRALGQVGLEFALDRGLGVAMGERGERFSGGECQRLCLARALLCEPRTLLLDEATSEVEPALAQRIAEHLVTLPVAVVFASHDPLFARLADRVLWLEGGRIVAEGRHNELLAAHSGYRAHWNQLGEAA